MTVENITSMLSPGTAKINASPSTIIHAVADTFGVAVEDLKGNSRRREISTARQVGMYLMRQHTELSLPKIGFEFGGKDHTTVMYSCDKVTAQQKKDPELAQTIRQLSDRINIASSPDNSSK